MIPFVCAHGKPVIEVERIGTWSIMVPTFDDIDECLELVADSDDLLPFEVD